MNINLKELTQEQIADLRNQLAELDKPSHFTDIKSWEDAFKMIRPDYVPLIDGCVQIDPVCNANISHTNTPSEAHAKSILASCKLMVIAEALNEGCKPDWGNPNLEKYNLSYGYMNKNLYVITNFSSQHSVIYFKSKEIAEYCAEQFKDLWYDYFKINE